MFSLKFMPLAIVALVIMTYVPLIYYPYKKIQQKNREINELKTQLIQCQQENIRLSNQMQSLVETYNAQLAKQQRELRQLYGKLKSIDISKQYQIEKPSTGNECQNLKIQLEQFKQIELNKSQVN